MYYMISIVPVIVPMIWISAAPHDLSSAPHGASDCGHRRSLCPSRDLYSLVVFHIQQRLGKQRLCPERYKACHLV